ncbi:magnesium chelatase [Crocinitomicaceae bacterium]|nr:magnesium chelatase [Crocinitomicaceae bacterium]
MNIQELKTLGALKKYGYSSKNIKTELRDNLMQKLRDKESIFDGIIGYDDTVIPQLINAILSQHNINLLGLRGQAKTRIARSLTNLLDEYIPIVEGSEINDDPMAPISYYAKDLVAKEGDKTPLAWVHRSERFSEKLATPDVTVADLIGDVDPIKAANLKLSYADERVIHFGMIPRANRCIFVINELPDLQARIQVSLFNILQEGDVQIRGFKIRLPLDVNFVFTANPEDYTNRGSIVTPLKDRIGSQIITHYPKTIDLAKEITSQEVMKQDQSNAIYVPELAKTLIEQIGFEARDNELIDAKSGVSARMSITMYENLISGATYRMLTTQQKETSVRMLDFMAIIPAITGKVELVYEGEQEGAENVALLLLGNAIKTLFNQSFREIKKLSKPGATDEFDAVVSWFMENSSFSLSGDLTDKEYAKILNAVKPLEDIVEMYQALASPADKLFLKEFLLWGLVEYNKLDKQEDKGGFQFEDRVLGSFYNN